MRNYACRSVLLIVLFLVCPQTKYDFNVGGNQTFRLFPTGSNRYPTGSEVFNSYGRRDNRHLLMEYGFAILDNEWETFLFHVRGTRVRASQSGMCVCVNEGERLRYVHIYI